MTSREKERPVITEVKEGKLGRIEKGARAKVISKAVVELTAMPPTRRLKALQTGILEPSLPTISP